MGTEIGAGAAAAHGRDPIYTSNLKGFAPAVQIASQMKNMDDGYSQCH